MLKTLISVHLCIQRHSGLNFFSETRCLQQSSECTDYIMISLSWAQAPAHFVAPAHLKKLGTLREEAAKCNNLVIAQKYSSGRWNWEGDGKGQQQWWILSSVWVWTQLWKKHIIKRQKASQGINVSGCSVIAYNQIDVIIVRQPITETAVIIRALTSSNTKLCNMAVSWSSSLSSCPTEKRGCAFISLY